MRQVRGQDSIQAPLLNDPMKRASRSTLLVFFIFLATKLTIVRSWKRTLVSVSQVWKNIPRSCSMRELQVLFRTHKVALKKFGPVGTLYAYWTLNLFSLGYMIHWLDSSSDPSFFPFSFSFLILVSVFLLLVIVLWIVVQFGRPNLDSYDPILVTYVFVWPTQFVFIIETFWSNVILSYWASVELLSC